MHSRVHVLLMLLALTMAFLLGFWTGHETQEPSGLVMVPSSPCPDLPSERPPLPSPDGEEDDDASKAPVFAKTKPSAAPPSRPINPNTATLEELVSLPGIGPSLAKRIIDHRERNGPISSVDELDRIKGIGPKLLERIRPFLVFDKPE